MICTVSGDILCVLATAEYQIGFYIYKHTRIITSFYRKSITIQKFFKHLANDDKQTNYHDEYIIRIFESKSIHITTYSH